MPNFFVNLARMSRMIVFVPRKERDQHSLKPRQWCPTSSLDSTAEGCCLAKHCYWGGEG